MAADTGTTHRAASAIRPSKANKLRAGHQHHMIGLCHFLSYRQRATIAYAAVDGKLIPKERLKAVPHATLSIEGKQQESLKKK